MTVIKRAFSALGKLGIVVAIAVAFFVGLVGTIYYSLRSKEVNVPNIVGKDILEGEKVLDQDGLNIRKRATRYSPSAKPNTILDQSPHAGEIVKVGQTVAVVVSRASAKEGEESVPSSPDDSATTENKNTNTEPSSAKNENENSNKSNKNTRNKNSNNSNNSNNGNANNRNLNRNTNANNANNRNTNNRNTNTRATNANRGNNNTSPNSNSGPRNQNSGRTNSNSNKRAPAPTTPPAGQNRNRRTP